MHRNTADSTPSRRPTLLPPPPLNPEVLETCWEPLLFDELSADDFKDVPPSSAPTHWQAGPPTECDALGGDDIHYRTIASALKL